MLMVLPQLTEIAHRAKKALSEGQVGLFGEEEAGTGKCKVKNLKTAARVYLAQNKLSKVPFKSFFTNTEKLIVFDVNQKTETLNFKYLFKNDLKNFLATNRKFDFIQFHLPSMQFRLAKLENTQNYFQLLQANRKSNVKQRGLGWESLSWSEDVQAFKPIALYDVIQYFRLN